MTTTTKPKQVDGAIQEITPTSVVLAGKTIYLHPSTRALFNSQNYTKGEVIRLRYDRDGNYIDSERLPREKYQTAMNDGGGESHTQFVPEHPEIHIQQGSDVGPKDHQDRQPTESAKVENLHIQKPKPDFQPTWVTEREKNDTIVLQSLLVRAVDIIDGMYRDYPELLTKTIIHEKSDFEDILITRCENIEFVTDRLFEYVKKKVKTE